MLKLSIASALKDISEACGSLPPQKKKENAEGNIREWDGRRDNAEMICLLKAEGT